jgi:hypothetical protein
MKKTAVEWLEFRYKNNITLNQYDFEEAKGKEKEKIIDAYNQGCIDTLKDGMKRGEQYYNETFNK